MKNFTVIALILIFILFSGFIYKRNCTHQVLGLNSPAEIIIDFNNNRVTDNNETIILDDILTFSTNIDRNKNVIDLLKISDEDSLRLGFLAENYAKDTLDKKKVKFDKGNIYINGINYRDLLLTKGFAVNKNGKMNSVTENNLQTARKINLVIFNKNSNKYHKLNCKYGQMAHDFIILPQSHLSKDAMPCKYCHNIKPKEVKNKIKTPDLMAKKYDIEILLTDMTKTLKPNNKCEDRVCKTLVREINSAKQSIDFAIYGYSKIPKIEQALTNAQERGVKIRFVYDTNGKTSSYPDTLYLADKFKNNTNDKSKYLMHNKFFIFDNQKVYTGSANIDATSMSGFNSNVVILINSKEAAEIFTKEFEQMYNGKFHENKKPVSQIPNSNLNIYFSPTDNAINNNIIPIIDNAQKYIYIPAFVITHENLAQSLIRAKNKGVDVKVILDATNTKYPSKISVLREAKIPVKTENYAGKLHSKTIITDDKYIITGSMNFSKSGEKYNDENILIIQDTELAKFYREFFTYLWNKIPDKWLKYSARAESPDSTGSCSDGIDNDFDEKIDKDDTGCQIKSK